MHCIKNVLQKLKRDGGRAFFGWVFLERESLQYGPYLIATHHAVWSAEGSTAGIDITPFPDDPKFQPYCPAGRILFLLDETAQPKTIFSRLSRPDDCERGLVEDLMSPLNK